MTYDYLIVGAGFAGCVLAERLASQCDKKILLIDRRSHIGGNAFDSTNEHGIRIHHYGPHLFHTNSSEVFSYLSQFTEWHPYEHRVLASVNGILVPMPVNRTTINRLLGYHFSTEEEVRAFLEQERECFAEIINSEEFVLSKVGRRLYELLYRGYTKKHWGCEPAALSPSVCGRLPVRMNEDDRYFDDRYQAMPREGYTAMFKRMTAQAGIDVELNTAFADVPSGAFNEVIYTGPIDEFFGFEYGRLPYRSLRFEFETVDAERVQPVAQLNYPNEFDYTRITEFKHITGQTSSKTTIAREYSAEAGEPYYPVPNPENARLYDRYAKAARHLNHVYFAGRLAAYRYYNMDQVVAHSLSTFNRMAHR
ncbi:MAG: UDP-galactopyranose mutase [Acidobacteriota bacterium]